MGGLIVEYDLFQTAFGWKDLGCIETQLGVQKYLGNTRAENNNELLYLDSRASIFL